MEPHHTPSGEMTGFSDKASDFDFTFEDTAHDLGVEETSDSPMVKLFFWSTPKTVCPEGFIGIHVRPRRNAEVEHSLPFLYPYSFGA